MHEYIITKCLKYFNDSIQNESGQAFSYLLDIIESQTKDIIFEGSIIKKFEKYSTSTDCIFCNSAACKHEM